MALGLSRNKKYNQGYYYPLNKSKYIGEMAIYRSGLELQYFKFLDNNPKCIKWNSEGVKIPYYWEVDKKWHNYYIDLAATFQEADGKLLTLLIEVKPYRQTLIPQESKRKRKKTLLTEQITFSQNQAKWKAASEFSLRNGFKFVIFTEKDLL